MNLQSAFTSLTRDAAVLNKDLQKIQKAIDGLKADLAAASTNPELTPAMASVIDGFSATVDQIDALVPDPITAPIADTPTPKPAPVPVFQDPAGSETGSAGVPPAVAGVPPGTSDPATAQEQTQLVDAQGQPLAAPDGPGGTPAPAAETAALP